MVDLNINKDLLPMKAHYFLWNAGLAPVIPFIPIYARQLGFSSLAVGTIYTFLPIFSLVSKPFFGAVADHFQLQKILFLTFQIITALVFFNIQFIPELDKSTDLMMDCDSLTYFKKCVIGPVDHVTLAKLQAEETISCKVMCDVTNSSFYEELCAQWRAPQFCFSALHQKPPSNNSTQIIPFQAQLAMAHTIQDESCLFFRVHDVVFPDSSSHVPYCNNLSSFLCSVDCHGSAVLTEVITQNSPDESATSSYQFWIIFVLLIFSTTASASVISVGDTICFKMLGDKPQRFGHQRLWGAIGWGMLSILAGYLIDKFSSGHVTKNYMPIFYLSTIMIILDMVASSRLKYSQAILSASIVRDVGRLLSELRVVIFLLCCIFIGLSTGLLWQFLFWHLEDISADVDQPWMKTLEGLVMGIRCFGGELPFFFLSGRILKMIGHIHAMSLVLAAFSIRFFLYAALTNPWWCLPIELLQGITYGIFYTAMASYANIAAPPGTEATVQGLVGAVFEGVGMSLGSLLGGVLYNLYGGGKAFLIYAITSLILFLAHVLVQYFLSKSPQHKIVFNGMTTRYTSPKDAISTIEEFDEIN
uniref:Major facilitator superfamily (MFS) profile domain-containing protein n=1 Tax=Timema poppense TaxID=170557 RepID=A0A7R9GZI0_TIMPO|nr:unnamed protein product [Timema poppensis]